MKKSERQLFAVAGKILSKYGQDQTLQQIIYNAAGWGENSANGIMNFPLQLQKDQADLQINVTISNGLLNNKKIVVDPPTVDPPQMADNYSKLPEQIKKYLEEWINNFPQLPLGTTTLRYSGKDSNTGVAQN